MSYNHQQIEKKWQQFWLKNQTFKTNIDDSKKPKSYILDMFPYPSGSGLHVGHPKGYCATDVISRVKRMNGFNVLHPIGWDAFGLPAEQYALNTGNNPETFTKENINNFRKQLQSIGLSFDYDKEVNTTDPQYYKWTQWIFIKLYEQGLAEIKDVEVNFCEQLGTVLANEEIINVNSHMVSERGNFPVIKKPMRQWVLKITKYAEQLLQGLDDLDWPHSVKELQRNWIGKSVGTLVDFMVENNNCRVSIFTSRVDTIFGVSFLALAPEHPLIPDLTTSENSQAVNQYCLDAKTKTDLMRQGNDTLKSGVFTGSYAIHPFTKTKLPIWVGDYVLSHYGTGAIMGVPAHDNRDFVFAKSKKIAITFIMKNNNKNEPFLGTGDYINSDFINGKDLKTATNLVVKKLVTLKQGKLHTVYKLRDWLFSRQRYWGEPFPIIYWANGTISTVNEKELPVLLPKMTNIKPSNDGTAPLANAPKSWLEVIRKDGIKGSREINTMPQWAGSCWYYLGYILKNDDGSYCDFNSSTAQKRFKYWLPVDLYIGGQEHAVLHLLYARFWHLVLYDLKLVNVKEPFLKLVNQGMILGENNEKMSKSRGNVVNPDDIIKEYGADTLRIYEMFMGPLTSSLPWLTSGLVGCHKFLMRVYRLVTSNDYKRKIVTNNDKTLDTIYHQTVKKVTNDINDLSFNTAIAQLMIFINACYKASTVYDQYLINFLKLLNPFAPHIAEELWFHLGNKESINKCHFPSYDEKFLITNEVTIAIQINGKTKITLIVKENLNKQKLLKIVNNEEKVKNWLQDKIIINTICVPNKIVNFVIK